MANGDLAIDYGTSNTVALVRTSGTGDGRTRQLLFDGSPLLPSAVLADRDGSLRIGRDAVRSARLDPARYEPNPKRRIDESEILLGDRVYPLAEITVTAEHVASDLTDEFGTLRTNADMVAERDRITPMLQADPDKSVAFVAEMDMDARAPSPVPQLSTSAPCTRR